MRLPSCFDIRQNLSNLRNGSMRQLNQISYRALKTAVKNLVSNLGGQEAAGSVTRVRHQAISDYASHQKTEIFAPVDVVLDLEASLGDPIVTRHLARSQGFELFRLTAGADVPVDAQMATAIGEEFGDLMRQAGKALEDDGRISGREVAEFNILKEIDDLIGRAVTVRMELQARMEEELGK